MAYIISSESHFEELARAIHSVIAVRVYLCREISISVADDIRNHNSKEFATSLRLGERKEQVLRLIAGGLSSKEIAQELHISPSTVGVHRRNIMQKIRLHKVADLTGYAIRNQIVSI
ncbi:MAG: response regulator transcription factor [Sheuella sp.]|nr:response regulator transcription factor [Sheuella sp.]